MIVQMRAGKYMVPVDITAESGRLYLAFPYSKDLLKEVQQMAGRRWHGYDEKNPRKIWSVPDNARNRFQISFLAGKNPYEQYDRPLIKAKPKRDILMPHQEIMFWHQITRIQAIISGEMGVGKTLSMIEALEYSGYTSIIWVGTGSSIAAVKLEFKKWKSPLKDHVLFLTYSTFRELVKKNELYVPEALIFDEAQKIKSNNSQVSEMADKLTEAMRTKLKDEAFIGLMSGAPAPKDPCDWWHLCEVACPGFLREGDWYKFRTRLAVMSEQTSASNQVYTKVEAWRDNENKCSMCGKLKEDHGDLTSGHVFTKSINEVEQLYQRMQGLNIVMFKKDVLKHLPELQYKVIKLEPSDLIVRAAKMIVDTTPRTVTALMKLRELSDGFQYKEEETGERETCELCKGSGKYNITETEGDDYEMKAVRSLEVTCPNCDGECTTPKMRRLYTEIACPKDNLLINLLEEHEDVARFVTYAGFQASVDRCVRIALKEKWSVIQADGRGWKYFSAQVDADLGEFVQISMSKEDMLERFQNKNFDDRVAFIAQGGAAGTGLTLTASPSLFCYSNTFNFDDRVQLINRIHRPGMDVNRGATIIDAIHLDSDQYVLDNLNAKADLLAMSLGKFRQAVQEYENIRRDDYVEYGATNGSS